MKVEFTKDEVVDLIKPFYKGCAFKLVFRKDKPATITFGCYLLIMVMTGKTRILHDLIEEKGMDLGLGYKELPLSAIMDYEESKFLEVEVLKWEPCGSCGAPFLKGDV